MFKGGVRSFPSLFDDWCRVCSRVQCQLLVSSPDKLFLSLPLSVISSISWRIFLKNLAHDWLERAVEAIFEKNFSRIT
jgi:hypothetical protein